MERHHAFQTPVRSTSLSDPPILTIPIEMHNRSPYWGLPNTVLICLFASSRHPLIPGPFPHTAVVSDHSPRYLLLPTSAKSRYDKTTSCHAVRTRSVRPHATD